MSGRWRYRAAGLVAVLVLAGCETTGDPNADTIFWSKEKADQRIATRQRILADQQQREASLRSEQLQLQQDDASSAKQRERLEQALGLVNAEIKTLEDALQSLPAPDPAELASVRFTLTQLRGRVEATLRDTAVLKARAEEQIFSLDQEIRNAGARVRILVGGAAPPKPAPAPTVKGP